MRSGFILFATHLETSQQVVKWTFMKRLYKKKTKKKTESPIFVLLCVFVSNSTLFRFLLYSVWTSMVRNLGVRILIVYLGLAMRKRVFEHKRSNHEPAHPRSLILVFAVR